MLYAVSPIKELGPSLGLLVNIGKCELFCKSDVSMFPVALKVSTLPHFEVLGAPIGDYIYCTSFVSSKQSEALKLLTKLEDVAIKDPPGCLVAFPSLSIWQELLQRHLSSRPCSSLTR